MKPEFSDPALALLADLVAEVRGLRADMAGRAAPPALRKDQSDALAALLPVLAGIYGDSRFSCWECVDVANQKTVNGANMKIALAGRTAQQLGKLLAQGIGRDFAGIQIVRDGSDANGNLWKCIANGSPLRNRED